jgi:hypothetical protein
MPDSTLQDDYRCFIIEHGQTQERYITGYTVQPGNADLVHHVILFQIPAESKAQVYQKDAADERPGYQCFGGPGVTVRSSEGGALATMGIGSWTPGSVDTFAPEGTGRVLTPGSIIVMQVHYNLKAGAREDTTRAVFQLAEPGAKLAPLRLQVLFAPVEIPCPQAVNTPECERGNALAAARAERGLRALATTTGLMTICRKRPADYIDQDASAVISECDRTVREDGLAVDVIGHMHTRGTSLRIEANPGTPDAKILLDIPEWDFHWQGTYQYVTPIPLKAGDVLRTTCTWDNSRDSKPRYIVWGEGTDDEMCLAAVTIAPPGSIK